MVPDLPHHASYALKEENIALGYLLAASGSKNSRMALDFGCLDDVMFHEEWIDDPCKILPKH